MVAAPASGVVHSLFGDRTCGALATVICGAGLRFTTVDEMVTEFMDALLNRTPCADSVVRCSKCCYLTVEIYNCFPTFQQLFFPQL